MSKFPKIIRLERLYFEEACTSALAFVNAVEKRYKDVGLKIPIDVKCLSWVCSCSYALLQPYISIMRKLQNENVHVSENSSKS